MKANENEIEALRRQNVKLSKKLARATSAPKDSQLERSSMEAYIGFLIAVVLAIVPMTWWLRSLLFLFLCGLGTDVAWRSPTTNRWPPLAKSFLAILIVSGIAWAGSLSVLRQIDAEEFPVGATYLVEWGPVQSGGPIILGGKLVSGVAASEVQIAGDRMINFARKYKVMAICFHWSGIQDALDLQDISKSGTFDIQGGTITIRIPWTQSFLRQAELGIRPTNYFLLLIPKNLSADDVRSIRDVTNNGGRLLERVSGP